ncbi:lysophospholipid acyltransferase family protein [Desulfobulbus sp.]|uniref:lysophospholipid acyltransferase family protein n=1 Tax=Desulfobulbus sp. TaxID=895 RepID=UPI00286F7D11|nr:lysophospholipid acyltransferase family protein [Desulfobulbus sp.]
MSIDPHVILVRMSRLAGPWFFAGVARGIACGYFLFSSKVQESRRLYAILFPERGRWFHLWCAFRQYQNFTTIHFDRFLTNCGYPPAFACEGVEALDARIGHGGALLLMSHLGNWEMAARLLMRQGYETPLLLYMGVKEKEGVERTQKEELQRAGIAILGAGRETASPFQAVEGLRMLQRGGLVSMAGDMVWRQDQRRIPVIVRGRAASVSEAPFVLALVSGAPIVVFFAFRTGRNRYRFTFSEPIWVRSGGRGDRQRALATAAQRYADLLESALRAHPCEWYHFDRFLHEPVEGP